MLRVKGNPINRCLEETPSKDEDIKPGAPATKFTVFNEHAYYVTKVLRCYNDSPMEVELVRPKVKCLSYWKEKWTFESYEECMKNIDKRKKVIVKRDLHNRFTLGGVEGGDIFVIGYAHERVDIINNF